MNKVVLKNSLTPNGKKILQILKKKYKGLDCALNFSNKFELLIAVSLSAQTTDLSVNKVTPKLFKEYDSPLKLSKAKLSDVEKILSSIGMYRTKAKNIISLSKNLLENFKGEIPNNFDDLIKLSGVGRKTANVVLAIGFNKQAIPVDTHVFRVTRRIGFSKLNTPEKIEKDLEKIIPKKDWNNYHNALIWHGRRVCAARKPLCDECEINKLCEKNFVLQFKQRNNKV